MTYDQATKMDPVPSSKEFLMKYDNKCKCMYTKEKKNVKVNPKVLHHRKSEL